MSTYQLNYLNFALGFFILIFYSIKIFSTIIVFLNHSYLNLPHNIIDLNNKRLNLIFSYFELNQFTYVNVFLFILCNVSLLVFKWVLAVTRPVIFLHSQRRCISIHSLQCFATSLLLGTLCRTSCNIITFTLWCLILLGHLFIDIVHLLIIAFLFYSILLIHYQIYLCSIQHS